MIASSYNYFSLVFNLQLLTLFSLDLLRKPGLIFFLKLFAMRFQLFTALSAGVAVAQQFVPTPRDLTSVTSELFPGAEISFKKVNTPDSIHSSLRFYRTDC